MSRSVLGLDIGGANLKAAHSDGTAVLQPFELWRHPLDLPEALRRLLGAVPPFDLLAVTMTGELCDCFPNKRAGVHAILDAVEAVAGRTPIRVWQTSGAFVDPATARDTALATAAANWLALATFAGRYASRGNALLFDVGSTTSDLIPLVDGRPSPRGRTDPERLRSGELVYTGVRRTPLCALLGPGVAAEFFATTLDVNLVLGLLPEDPEERSTADGRPATIAAAHARLARMLCADDETCNEAETTDLALRTRARQIGVLCDALRQVVGGQAEPLRTVILAGSGEFLARVVLSAMALAALPVISLTERLGPAISQAACAYAVAVLAGEQDG
jgi:probable H4MPT-linked C1 transfer pathway protein